MGSFCALAHARAGARVALLEANPKASTRLAGEWLHPPAVRMLRDIGLSLDAERRSAPGKGFVVLPEDGSEPIVLPYPEGWSASPASTRRSSRACTRRCGTSPASTATPTRACARSKTGALSSRARAGSALSRRHGSSARTAALDRAPVAGAVDAPPDLLAHDRGRRRGRDPAIRGLRARAARRPGAGSHVPPGRGSRSHRRRCPPGPLDAAGPHRSPGGFLRRPVARSAPPRLRRSVAGGQVQGCDQ